MREIASLSELQSLVGQEVAVSDWVEISQRRINQFAEATGDYQWIHVDIEKSRRESPFGGTIAHGFLTLALLPALMSRTIAMPGSRMEINYGLNKLRFPAPVPAGSRVRARMKLLSLEPVADAMQMIWQVTFERDGGDKPVCVAEFIARRYS